MDAIMAVGDSTQQDLRIEALAHFNMKETNNRYGGLIDRWLNRAQYAMAKRGKGIEDIWETQSLSGKMFMPLPPGFRVMRRLYFNGYPLAPVREVSIDFFDQGSSLPDSYAIWGNQLIFGPLAVSGAYPINGLYFRQPKVMVGNNAKPEVPEEFREYLIDYVYAKMLTLDGKTQEAQAALQSFFQGCEEYKMWQEQDKRDDDYLSVLNVMGY